MPPLAFPPEFPCLFGLRCSLPFTGVPWADLKGPTRTGQQTKQALLGLQRSNTLANQTDVSRLLIHAHVNECQHKTR